jgi:hypothetical protein
MNHHQLVPGDLQNNPNFELIEEVAYTDLKALIMKEIGYKSVLIKCFSIAQVIAIALLAGIIGFYLFGFMVDKAFKAELIAIAAALVFSFTLLIIVHELLHAAAFRILGKRDIGFGAQWKKFLFYAESNREVLDRREMLVVALAPFVVILIAGLLCYFFIPYKPLSLGGLVVVLTHFFFCGGDFAIISFFNRHKPSEIYTFDDRNAKRSYYFKKVVPETGLK